MSRVDIVSIIKQRVSCRDFVDRIGYGVTRTGFCRCPLHVDKTPSLKIYEDKNRGWCCFSCHKGGDVIALAQAYYGTPFNDTIKALSAEFGLGDISEDERLKIAAEVAAEKAEREKRREQKAKAEAEYWLAFDRALENERAIKNLAPKDKNEPFKSEFARAIREREFVELELDIAERKRA